MLARKILLSALACSASPMAWAQETPPAPATAPAKADSGFDDIIVTARKKSVAETAQSVPAAISALDGRAIEKQHITSLTQLATNVPSVQMSEAGAFKGSANFASRGLGTISSIPTVEGTVGVFVDGIYLPTQQGVVFDLFDLDGIEVLRGPQGTLFGKNVTGGAVLLRTRDPSKTFGADFRAGLINGPEYKISGSVTGPITPTLSARLSISYDDDKGKYRDSLTHIRRGYSSTFLVRPSIAWEPVDGFRTILKYEHGSITGDAIPTKNLTFYPKNDFAFSNDFKGLTDLKWNQITSTTTVDVGIGANGLITNIAGYRNMDDFANKDIDATKNAIFHDNFFVGVKQYSDELRYSGRLFDRVDLVFGGSYFHSKILSVEQRSLAALALSPRGFGGKQLTDSYSVFAQADIDLVPALTLTLGGRYGSDTKKASIAIFSSAVSRCSLSSLTCTYNLGPLENTYNYFTPKVGLKYAFSDRQQIYASWTKAYRAGGFNVRITSASQQPNFGQESNSQFEVGTKVDLFSNRLRLNAAVYQSKINNMIRDVDTSLVSGGAQIGTVQDSRNTANVTIRGVEFDAHAKVAPGLTIGGFFAYTHAKYDKILFSLVELPGETVPVINAADYALKLPRLVPWQYGGSFEYTTAVSKKLSVTAEADISHRDGFFGSDSNSSRAPSFTNLNANLSFDVDGGKYSVSVFGRNLLNRLDVQVSGQLPASVVPGPTGGPSTTYYMPAQAGRTYGIEVSARF